MWFKQGFLCHRLFGKHVWFFRTELGWRNGGIVFWSWSSFHSRVRWFSWQDPAQMPIFPGCFITTSGTCVHSSGCHHGKRAEVQKIPVRFCECFSENGFRHLPHTTEVFLDFRDFLHQSRFCEAFSRRHHPLSQMAVKRIVKKCRHCLWAQISEGHRGVIKEMLRAWKMSFWGVGESCFCK